MKKSTRTMKKRARGPQPSALPSKRLGLRRARSSRSLGPPKGSALRVGQGYDVHPLGPRRKLMLGGVEIPHTKGLEGHSDADALVHAVCDALLGAMGEGDLGRHFPSSDPTYKDISSLKLLEHVCDLLAARRYRIVNVDATIIAQAPRLGSYLATMAKTMAATMKIDASCVNVKVKSGEGLDAVGREEGIATQAVCLIESVPRK